MKDWLQVCKYFCLFSLHFNEKPVLPRWCRQNSGHAWVLQRCLTRTVLMTSKHFDSNSTTTTTVCVKALFHLSSVAICLPQLCAVSHWAGRLFTENGCPLLCIFGIQAYGLKTQNNEVKAVNSIESCWDLHGKNHYRKCWILFSWQSSLQSIQRGEERSNDFCLFWHHHFLAQHNSWTDVFQKVKMPLTHVTQHDISFALCLLSPFSLLDVHICQC